MAQKSNLLIVFLAIAVLGSCSLALQSMASEFAMGMNGMDSGMSMPCCVFQPFAGVDTEFSKVLVPQGGRDLLLVLFAFTILVILHRTKDPSSLYLRGSPIVAQWIQKINLRKNTNNLERAFSRGILHPRLYELAVALN